MPERCLLKAGISHGELLEAYMEVFRKWNGKKAGKLLQLLESIGVLALNWTRLASRYSTSFSNLIFSTVTRPHIPLRYKNFRCVQSQENFEIGWRNYCNN